MVYGIWYMVLYGMGWYGMVWHGMVWYGMVYTPRVEHGSPELTGPGRVVCVAGWATVPRTGGGFYRLSSCLNQLQGFAGPR